jgi:hypothetical protein
MSSLTSAVAGCRCGTERACVSRAREGASEHACVSRASEGASEHARKIDRIHACHMMRRIHARKIYKIERSV